MRSDFYLSVLAWAVAAGSTACTGLADKAKSAQSTTAEIGARADGAIRRGIQSGSDAVGRTGKAVEGPVDRAAKKAGLPGGPVSPPTTDH